jgi:hypothetical protein
MSAAVEPAAAPAGELAWADDETLREVRPAVAGLLRSTDAYARLDPDERRDLAQRMVKVAAYLSKPEGIPADELEPQAAPLAEAQADAAEEARKRLAKDPGFAGKDFEAGAVRAGVEQFGELVKKVDFPKFVAGLIEGVFQAIVDSSLEQMKAYGELLGNVAKTVDQFAQDNISMNNSRDWLAERFPNSLGIEETSSSGSFAEGDPPPPPDVRLAVKAEDPEAALREISTELGLTTPITDISDEQQEAELVRQARLQMARGRQQLLASMVMLGINRIVVTDGLIHAKVVFDMRASDVAAREARASMYDRRSTSTAVRASAKYGGWFSPISARVSTEHRSDHVATVSSSVDDTSESKAEVKAKLTGEVRVNFKSDYMPMEKLANPQMIAAIQGNATPPEQPVAGA